MIRVWSLLLFAISVVQAAPLVATVGATTTTAQSNLTLNDTLLQKNVLGMERISDGAYPNLVAPASRVDLHALPERSEIKRNVDDEAMAAPAPEAAVNGLEQFGDYADAIRRLIDDADNEISYSDESNEAENVHGNADSEMQYSNEPEDVGDNGWPVEGAATEDFDYYGDAVEGDGGNEMEVGEGRELGKRALSIEDALYSPGIEEEVLGMKDGVNYDDDDDYTPYENLRNSLEDLEERGRLSDAAVAEILAGLDARGLRDLEDYREQLEEEEDLQNLRSKFEDRINAEEGMPQNRRETDEDDEEERELSLLNNLKKDENLPQQLDRLLADLDLAKEHENKQINKNGTYPRVELLQGRIQNILEQETRHRPTNIKEVHQIKSDAQRYSSRNQIFDKTQDASRRSLSKGNEEELNKFANRIKERMNLQRQ